jgi:hypothetical protein
MATVTATTETVMTTTTTAVAAATKTTTTYGGGNDAATATATATTATVTATTAVVIPPYLTHLVIHDTRLYINSMYYYYDRAQTQKSYILTLYHMYCMIKANTWATPNPSTGMIAHGTGMTLMCLLWASPRYGQWYGP